MNYKHGRSKGRLYGVWNAMINRCHNPNQKAWPHYGGRGITVCDAWRHSFEAFLADMGERPGGCSLERLDNNGPYSPENVIWATKEQQDANKRSNRLELYNGVLTPLFLIARDSGVPYCTLAARIRLGYTADEAAKPDFDSHGKNAKRAREKAAARTHCANGHELTADNTYMYSASRPVKCCKQCRKENRLRRLGRAPEKPGRVEVTIG